MKKCPYCGKLERNPNTEFCKVCGKELTSLSNENLEERQNILRGKDFYFLLFAIIFMGIAVALSFGHYKTTVPYFFFFKKTKEINIKPDMISTLCAAGIYTAMLVRGIFKFNLTDDGGKNIILKIILLILNLLYLSSFLHIFLDGKPLFKHGPVWLTPESIAIFAVVLTWIGMKIVAGYIWILLLILVIPRLGYVNNAMGFAGVVYIICGYVSFILQVRTQHAIQKFGTSFVNDFRVATSAIGEDIHFANENTKALY